MSASIHSRRGILKLGLAAGVAAAAPVALGGRIAPAARAQEQVTLRFFHKWPEPEQIAFYQGVIDAFQAENPNIKVQMDAVGDEPYKDKIRILMASGDVPDIYFSWAGEFAWKFARAGRALDLTSAFNDTDWKDNVVNSATEPYMWDGKLFGIPMRINAKFMAYSKAKFDELGLSAPTTWDEFLAVCGAMKESGLTPISFGNQFPWASSHYVGDFNAKLVANDVRMADYRLEADADALFIDPNYVEALSRFKSLNDEGYFNNSPNGISHDQARTAFIAGRSGMIYLELEEFVNLAESPMGQDGFGFFQFPSGTGGAGDQKLITGAPDGFMISSATKYPEEAIAFLKYLTLPKNGKEYVKQLGIPSASVGAVTEENAIPQVVEGVNQIAAASGLALWLDTDMNTKVVEAYLPGFQALLTGSKDPQGVMDDVHNAAVEAQTDQSDQ
ncbi:MAG: extracellular solute-binding protein [Thermomicrobiales bacterium]|nr:extracellular solute-binding protein [Thermomicrobiales bacterium]